jgi:hypothetical protein
VVELLALEAVMAMMNAARITPTRLVFVEAHTLKG